MAQIRPWRYMLLVSVLSVIVAACGNPTGQTTEGEATDSEKVFAQYDDMDPSQRVDALVEAAEEEGAVVAYLRVDEVGPELETAFEAKYNVDLQILNPGTSAVVRQQVLEQSRAGRLEADLVETYMHELTLVYDTENIVAKMPEFLKEDLVADDMSSEYGLETYQTAFLAGSWNSSRITGDDVPTALEDFTGPLFGDRLVMVANYEMAYKTLFDYLTTEKRMTPEAFTALFRTIGDNTSVTDSSNPAAAFLASGQYLGGVNVSMTSIQKAGNVPVAYEPAAEPVSLVPFGIGLTKQAPHPAAAMLFAHWYITDGQSILQKEQYIDQSPEETDLRNATTTKLSYDDLDPRRLEQWRIAYDNMIRGEDDVLPEYVTASN